MQTVGQIMQGHDQVQQQLQSSQLDVRGFSGHLKALNGLYNANGENHGKPKWIKHNSVDKTQQSCVYFWDERDGADMSGWWVAPQVGGEQVWAHANLQAVQQAAAMGGDGMGPPKTGWKAPWHSQAPDPAVVMEIRFGGGGMAGGAAAGGMNAAGAGGTDGTTRVNLCVSSNRPISVSIYERAASLRLRDNISCSTLYRYISCCGG